jgi:hypothetical protein
MAAPRGLVRLGHPEQGGRHELDDRPGAIRAAIVSVERLTSCP